MIFGSRAANPLPSPSKLFERERNDSEICTCVTLPQGEVTVRSLQQSGMSVTAAAAGRHFKSSLPRHRRHTTYQQGSEVYTTEPPPNQS